MLSSRCFLAEEVPGRMFPNVIKRDPDAASFSCSFCIAEGRTAQSVVFEEEYSWPTLR